MVIGWQAVLAVSAVLFLGFLLVKMRPRMRSTEGLGAEVLAARRRAHEAKTPRARAEALCEAGALALGSRAGYRIAAAFFLRAMNADPTWPDPVQQAAYLLRRRRPRLLEKLLWRRLGHVPWDEAHRIVLAEVVSCLKVLHERELRDPSKAEVFRRLGEKFAPAHENS